MSMQFCRDGMDISSDINAAEDADAVRVWGDDGCIVEVVLDETTGTWSYGGSDYGAEPGWPTEETFGSYQSALKAFGQ